jgi:5-methylcytosine-specific restriction enzyme A
VRGWDELDHIVPLHKGGTDARDNLVGLCMTHHAAKTAADMGHRAAGACDETGVPLDPAHHWRAAGGG